jgi:hypothetical protein
MSAPPATPAPPPPTVPTPIELKLHDLFNVIALTIVTLLSLSFLTQATELDKLGTNQIGQGFYEQGEFLHRVFGAVVLFDTIWVILLPTSVAGNQVGIVVHHILCLFLISIPLFVPQFFWHGAASMSVEVNTLLRYMSKTHLIYTNIRSKSHLICTGLPPYL